MNIPQITGLAGIGAIAAMIAAGWGHVRTVARWASDLVICRAMVGDDAALAIMAYCWHQGRRSPFGLRLFGGSHTWVQPRKRVQVVAYESVSSDPILFWFGRVPVIIGRRRGNDDTNAGELGDSRRAISITFVRGTMTLDSLVIKAVTHFNHTKQGTNGQSKRRRFFVERLGAPRQFGELAVRSGKNTPDMPATEKSDLSEQVIQKTVRLLEWKPEDLIAVSPDRSPFHGYAFPPAIMEAMNEIQLWLKHEAWFRDRCVPWRRGWLLHGPPGTGKSTLVRAMAMHFDLPVFSIDLSGQDNESFVEAWGKTCSNAPCIALIEDVDAVFSGRKNIAATNTTRNNLTFDCLLNCISGVGNSEGVFLIVTTNHPETLDPALGVVEHGKSSRPGRIDRVIELGFMDEPERQSLAKHILADFPDELPTAVHGGDGMTPAQFQDHCAQIALRRFWLRAQTPCPASR